MEEVSTIETRDFSGFESKEKESVYDSITVKLIGLLQNHCIDLILGKETDRYKFSKQVTKIYFVLRRMENERTKKLKNISLPLSPLIEIIQKLAIYKKRACSACSSRSEGSPAERPRPEFPDNIPHVLKLTATKSQDPKARYLSQPPKKANPFSQVS